MLSIFVAEMGTKERKQKEKEQLRQSILDAARTLFFERGYDHTSIRAIAERIEYSPTTIYLYFKDKDDLFKALHDEGFGVMRSMFIKLMEEPDPFERLVKMGRMYIEFAEKYPEYYDLMFLMRAPMKGMEEAHKEWNEGENTFHLLQSVVAQCQQKGHFVGHDTEVLAFCIWSMMHGMVSLKIRERSKVITEAKQPFIPHLGLEDFVRILRKG